MVGRVKVSEKEISLGFMAVKKLMFLRSTPVCDKFLREAAL